MIAQRGHQRGAFAWLRWVAMAAVFSAACGDDPTAPVEPGTILVSVQTSGGDPDNSYELMVGGARRIIGGNATVDLNVNPGPHTVALNLVSENCTLEGQNPRSVTVAAAATVQLAFTIVCETTGIEIHTRTTGPDTPASYQVVVGQNPPLRIDATDTAIVSYLRPGTYKVTLYFVSGNCSVAGGSELTVEVSNRSVTPAVFDITCVPAVRSRKIAFSVYGMTQTIAVVNEDGSGLQELEPGHSPSWSPDGKRIVYTTAFCDYYYTCAGTLRIIDPETRNIQTLNSTNTAFSPAWSPAGDVIAFFRCCSFNGLSSSFHLITPDGISSLEVPVIGDIGVKGRLSWSPDARRIAFTCVVIPGNDDVCVANRDGTGLVRLTSTAGPDDGPAWSPDGTRIAFATDNLGTGRREIAIMNTNGTAVTRVAEGFSVAWSPDGSRLVMNRGDGLFIVNSDGSNASRLTFGNHSDPVWRP